MTEPVIPGAGRSLRIGVGAAVTGLFVRAALLVMVFGIFRHSWPEYLRTSDGGSFVSLSRVLAGLDRVEHLTLYDTRVFPGWPLLAAPFLAVGLPEQSVLVLALICAALAPWLYLTLTGDTAGTWLLAVFPPAWLLATRNRDLHLISIHGSAVIVAPQCAPARGFYHLAPGRRRRSRTGGMGRRHRPGRWILRFGRGPTMVLGLPASGSSMWMRAITAPCLYEASPGDVALPALRSIKRNDAAFHGGAR